jgi:hypothetical protein
MMMMIRFCTRRRYMRAIFPGLSNEAKLLRQQRMPVSLLINTMHVYLTNTNHEMGTSIFYGKVRSETRSMVAPGTRWLQQGPCFRSYAEHPRFLSSSALVRRRPERVGLWQVSGSVRR